MLRRAPQFEHLIREQRTDNSELISPEDLRQGIAVLERLQASADEADKIVLAKVIAALRKLEHRNK